MKPRPVIWSGCAAALLITVCASPAQAIPILNPSFEDVVLGAPYKSSNTADVPGWTRVGAPGDAALWAVGYADGSGSITTAGDGNQFITMGGGYGPTGFTTWEQALSGLVVGQAYELDFLMAAEAANGPFGPDGITQTLTAWVIGLGTVSQTFTATNDIGNYWRDWEAKSFTFIADSTSPILRFGYDGRYDVGLDQVRVNEANPTAVPEPTTLGLFGLGLAGFRLFRRRV